jgi:hypothetical protein
MKTEDELFEEVEIPVNLEARLENLIDDLAKAENLSKQKTKQVRLWVGSIAAGIALILSVGLYYLNPGTETDALVTATQPNEITDPEAACIEAQKALILVSRNFNKGLNQLAMVSEELDKSNQILNKTFKK